MTAAYPLCTRMYEEIFTVICTLLQLCLLHSRCHTVVTANGRRTPLAQVGVLDAQHMRGKRNEPSETGASTSHCSEQDNSPANSLIMFNEHS